MKRKKITGNIIRLRKMVNLSGIKNGYSVLDLGCGSDKLRNYIGDRITSYFPISLHSIKYIGVDTDFTDKELKTGLYIKYNLESGLSEKILTKKFDIIFIGELLEHIENFKRLLNQCKNCLTKNGKIILSVPNPLRFNLREHPEHIHSFTDSNIKNLSKIIGVRVVKKVGTFISIPLLKIDISCSFLPFTTSIIYVLEK